MSTDPGRIPDDCHRERDVENIADSTRRRFAESLPIRELQKLKGELTRADVRAEQVGGLQSFDELGDMDDSWRIGAERHSQRCEARGLTGAGIAYHDRAGCLRLSCRWRADAELHSGAGFFDHDAVGNSVEQNEQDRGRESFHPEQLQLASVV